jgi:ubiquinone/menaquinone biosynthesis C-methylase UbiE
MSNYEFKERGFDHPTILFILEDILKGLIGGSLLYYLYYNTFGLEGNEKILDFGCGGGTGSRCLANILNRDGHLTCIDSSAYWIGKAKKRLQKFANVECKYGNIKELDIPNSAFDVITIFHVVHDIPPTKRQDTTKILSQKLKEGGKLFIRERIEKSHGMPVHEIRALLSEAGLKEIEYKVTKTEYMGKYQKAS